MFGKLSLRTKLFMTYSAMIFIPLVLLTLILYNSVFRVFEEQMRRSAGRSFQQAHAYLSTKISQIITISDTIYFNTDVQSMLVKRQDDYEDDVIQQTIDMQTMDAFLNSFRSEDMYRACLYVPSWFMYANQGIYIDNYDEFKLSDTYQALIANRDKVLWIPGDQLPYEYALFEPVDVISLYRRVRNRSQIDEVIGVIRLSLRQSSIDVIVANADISQNGVVFLKNQSGQIVSRSNEANLDMFLGAHPQHTRPKGTQWYTLEGGEPYLLMEQPLPGTDWIMTCAIPYSELLSQSENILVLMITLVAVIGAAAYLVTYLVSRSSVRRIMALTKQMKSVHSESVPAQAPDVKPKLGRDELDQMTDTFHFMLQRIDVLAQEQYQHGMQIKSAELRALQAQINPHFLYNTLELINWKASEHDAPEIVAIVRALAQFYKLSLGRGRDIVPLRNELDHIRAYVHIQNERFEQGIALIIEVDDAHLDYQVPKISLQPLVENAIMHGILCKEGEPRGTIRISARIEDGDLVLSVQDDGVGMDEESANLLLTPGQSSPENGYGIYNIDHRLKLSYGQQYGLRFRFPEEGGVIAELCLPPILIRDA